MVREILAAVRGNTPGRKLIWNWSTAAGFHYFSNFEEENGLEYFYFVGKLSVRLLLRALDDCSQLKIQLRIGKVICGFPGRTSKLAKLADVVYKFQRSFTTKYCRIVKNVCRQLQFSKLGSTSSFFFSRTNSAIHTTNNYKKFVNQYVQHDFWGTKVFCFCLLTSNIVEKKFHAEKLVRRSLHFNLNEKNSWNEQSICVEWWT